MPVIAFRYLSMPGIEMNPAQAVLSCKAEKVMNHYPGALFCGQGIKQPGAVFLRCAGLAQMYNVHTVRKQAFYKSGFIVRYFR